MVLVLQESRKERKMEEIRIIVAGSRDFSDYQLMEQTLNSYLESKISGAKIQFVSGTARGADKLGERFAQENGYEVKRFPAQWEIYGKSAGYRRNATMAEYAAQESGVLFAFWDGSSRGTMHMINLARGKGLDVHIVRF